MITKQQKRSLGAAIMFAAVGAGVALGADAQLALANPVTRFQCETPVECFWGPYTTCTIVYSGNNVSCTIAN